MQNNRVCECFLSFVFFFFSTAVDISDLVVWAVVCCLVRMDESRSACVDCKVTDVESEIFVVCVLLSGFCWVDSARFLAHTH